MSPYSGNCWLHALVVVVPTEAAVPPGGITGPLETHVTAKYKRIEKISTAQQIPSALPR